MATKPGAPKINLAQILGKRGFASEVAKQRKAEAEQRQQARTILDPLDVAGEYDAARLLKTTLGGEVRAITLDDLRAFADSARRLGKRFKGGITARGVIDASLQVDRDRANTQIRTAVVVKAQAGMLHFVTNAGPDSDAVRHHVHVEFPSFKAFSASPQDPRKLARPMLDGPMKFDCDCGRHRYWYRYIATKGGFAALRPETGFPKVRNPTLVGVACKHVLRVMAALTKDANVTQKAAAMIAAAQKNDTRAQITSASEAKAAAQKQLAQAHHVKNQAETTAQQAARRASTPAGKAKALMAAAKEAQKRAQAQALKSRKALQAAFDKLATAPLTKAMCDALIAKLQAASTID